MQVEHHANLSAQWPSNLGVSTIPRWRLQLTAVDLGRGEVLGSSSCDVCQATESSSSGCGCDRLGGASQAMLAARRYSDDAEGFPMLQTLALVKGFISLSRSDNDVAMSVRARKKDTQKTLVRKYVFCKTETDPDMYTTKPFAARRWAHYTYRLLAVSPTPIVIYYRITMSYLWFDVPLIWHGLASEEKGSANGLLRQ